MHQKPYILVAEDDPDDQLLLNDAISAHGSNINVRFVNDGQALVDDLLEQLNQEATLNLPSVIILDLNMPRLDGKEALRFVKSTSRLKRIPTIVLTTSRAKEDIVETYDLGTNSFITKPANYSDMLSITELINSYWLQTVQLPR